MNIKQELQIKRILKKIKDNNLNIITIQNNFGEPGRVVNDTNVYIRGYYSLDEIEKQVDYTVALLFKPSDEYKAFINALKIAH